MTARSWFDRLTLGRAGAKRADEADRRMAEEEAEADRLREDARRARERLFAAVADMTAEAQRVAEDAHHPPPLAAAVAELAGPEGLDHAEQPESPGIDPGPTTPR